MFGSAPVHDINTPSPSTILILMYCDAGCDEKQQIKFHWPHHHPVMIISFELYSPLHDTQLIMFIQ